MIDNIIKEIHNSDKFGVVIEAGCSTTISGKLLNVAGSSKTIHHSLVPYSKEHQKVLFNIEGGIRSVSKEWCKGVLESYKNFPESGNLIVVSTFQVGDKGDISTHGWILIKYKNKIRYIHISIHDSLDRIEYLNKIGYIGINIINEIDNDHFSFPDNHIDAIYDENFTPLIEEALHCVNSKSENMIIIENGNFLRFDDIIRRGGELIVYKGSFRPLCKSHRLIAETAIKNIEGSQLLYSISLNTFGKGIQDLGSVVNRIKIINHMGGSVLIVNNPLFIDMVNALRIKWREKVYFPVGYDTIERILEDYKWDGKFLKKDFDNNFSGITFVIIPRDGYPDLDDLLKGVNIDYIKIDELLSGSATLVRESLINGNNEVLDSLLDNGVLEFIKSRNIKI